MRRLLINVAVDETNDIGERLVHFYDILTISQCKRLLDIVLTVEDISIDLREASHLTLTLTL